MTFRLPLLVVLALAAFGCAQSASKSAHPRPLILAEIDEDAAPIYEKPGWKNVELPEEIYDYHPGDVKLAATIDEVLKTHHESILELLRAARCVRCTWRSGASTLFDDFPGLVGPSRFGVLLHCRIVRLAELGNVDDALETLVSGFKIGADYMSHPLLISKIVGAVLMRRMSDAFQAAFWNSSLGAHQLLFLDSHLEQLCLRIPRVRDVLEGERRFLLRSIDKFLELGFSRALEKLAVLPTKRSSNPIMAALESLLDENHLESKQRISDCLTGVFDLMLLDASEPLNTVKRHFDERAFKDRVMETLKEWELGRRTDREKGLDAAAQSVVLMLAPRHTAYRKTFSLIRFSLEAIRVWARVHKAAVETGRPPGVAPGIGESSGDPFDGKSAKYVLKVQDGRIRFVITAAGPKDDWQSRVADLDSKCGFDLRKFRGLSKSHDETADYTWIGTVTLKEAR